MPAFFLIYALCKPVWRPAVMSAGSCIMIGWASPYALIPMAVSVLLSYFCGIICHDLREKRSAANAVFALFTVCITVQAAYYFLFSQSRAEHITVIGLGVISLHSVAYVFDVNSGEQPETGFFKLCAYVTFMPCLNGIPFVRYNDIRENMAAPRLRIDLMSDGIMIMLLGICEKVIVSDRLEELFYDMQTVSSGTLSALMSWMGAMIFGAALYIRLKGLSHIAVGLAMMLGFSLNSSFDYPYSKPTLRGYIESFNISAVGFAKRYIFTPLSGGKKEGGRVVFAAAFSTLLLCVSYRLNINHLLWGAFAALLLITEIHFEGRLSRVPRPVRYIFSHMFILIGWAMISQSTTVGAMDYISRMFTGGMLIDFKPLLYFLGTALPYFLLILIFEMPFFRTLIIKHRSKRFSVIAAAKPFLIFAMLILCTSFMMSGGLQAQ